MKKLLVLFVPVLSSCSIITIPEFYPYQFNANSGDTLNVVMNPEGDILGRCNDMGGELIYNPATLIYTCEHVDF